MEFVYSDGGRSKYYKAENEMIEEIGSVYDIKEVKELHDDLLKCLSYDEWSSREYGTDTVDFDDTAYSLYKIGYRKIPDGAVVLNIGKNNDALDEKTIEFFVKHNAEVRKQTAREILQRIFNKDECGDLGEFCGTGWIYDIDEANAIFKEYSVEVEE